MSELVRAVRELFWSDICVSDAAAYKLYLASVDQFLNHGCGVIELGRVGGARKLQIDSGCRTCAFSSVVGEGVRVGDVKDDTVVGCAGVAAGPLDSENPGDCCDRTVEASVVDCGVSSDLSGDRFGGVFHDRNDVGVQGVESRGPVHDAAVDDGPVGRSEAKVLGKNHVRNKARRERDKQARKAAARDSGVSCCGSASASGGSVHTVDTRTGVEIEAAQTLAARRVAENNLAVKKAEADKLLVEHRIRALQDKSRTKAIEKLAAVRMEERINKSKKNSEEAFKQCEASLKSLGSTGSAGEFALKQQIKDARDNEAILKYVQEQNKIYSRNASPEVLDAVSRVKPPVIQEEYDAFGDCPSDYDEDEAEAYNNDRNRRNDEMAQRLQGMDEAPLW